MDGRRRSLRVSGIIVTALAAFMAIFVALWIANTLPPSPLIGMAGYVCFYAFTPWAISGAMLLYYARREGRVPARR